jgi:hypothetical protein
LVKVSLKGDAEKEGVEGRCMGLVVFVALICVRVYFYCCSGGYLCQGLQRAGVVNRRLVNRW